VSDEHHHYEYTDHGIPTSAEEHAWLSRFEAPGVFPASMDEDARETYVLWALIQHKRRRWRKCARWLRPSLLLRMQVALRLMLTAHRPKGEEA